MLCDLPQVVCSSATVPSSPNLSFKGRAKNLIHVSHQEAHQREPLDSLLQTACTQLRVWNLLVNESKTEFTHIYLADASEADDQGAATRGNETWHGRRSLGSMLCSFTDIMHHYCVLGNLSFHSF